MFSTAVQILVKVEHVTIPWWSGDPSNNDGCDTRSFYVEMKPEAVWQQ